MAEIREIKARGHWPTKSGGKLIVPTIPSNLPLLGIPIEFLNSQFFNYEKEELEKLPTDIRGFRIYLVRDIPNHKVGGTEFHRIREEMVICLEGFFVWKCEDIIGNSRSFFLKPGDGVWMPPYILHTYRATKEKNSLLVLCNTLFNPDDEWTKDTYPVEEFSELQEEIKSKSV